VSRRSFYLGLVLAWTLTAFACRVLAQPITEIRVIISHLDCTPLFGSPGSFEISVGGSSFTVAPTNGCAFNSSPLVVSITDPAALVCPDVKVDVIDPFPPGRLAMVIGFVRVEIDRAGETESVCLADFSFTGDGVCADRDLRQDFNFGGSISFGDDPDLDNDGVYVVKTSGTIRPVFLERVLAPLCG
jgi:hypothetical protein